MPFICWIVFNFVFCKPCDQETSLGNPDFKMQKMNKCASLVT